MMSYTLQIRKRGQNELLCLLVLFAYFCFSFLFEVLGLPIVLKYVIDIIWVILLITIVINKFRMPNVETKSIFDLFVAYFIFTLVGYILNGYTPLYYLWGFRNNFRFFVFFTACAMFVKQDTAEKILSLFHKLVYVNFVLTLYQFFVMGKEMDYLGGIFGTEVGCNAQTLIFLSIMDSLCILQYIKGKKKLWMVGIECGMSVIVAALAELKFYYIVFVCIVALTTLITNFSIKKVWIIVFGGLGIYFGTRLLVVVFPKWEGIFNIANMIETASSSDGYTGRGGLNRLTAVPIVWEEFLDTWIKRLFGLGLGSCDTSGFSIVNTPFYQKYEYLRYNWFSSSFVLLETGAIGLAIYILIFVLIYVNAFRREKSISSNQEWCQLARILSVVCLLLIIYNSSLRIEQGYMMYFALALPFINTSTREKKND